jgi:hypothetical protein
MRTIILLIFLMLSAYHYSRASHAMGADISYTCLGNNQYYVTYTFYRDCSGIPAPLTMDLNVGGNIVVLTPAPFSPVQLHTVCRNDTTTCDGGIYTGVEKWVYQGTVTLSGPGSWIIYHSENARNAALTTITGAGSDDLFVYAVIDNTNNLCNNSPVFNMDPLVTICQGINYCIPAGVTDPDGDSLVYELITPRNGPNPSDTVTYNTGYSATSPFMSVPPMTFDPNTGEICLTVIQTDVSPIAMLVSEYRDGVLIGQVERDIQISVVACNNNPPVVRGINGTNSYNQNVCATLANCFFITAIDVDAQNTTIVNWDYSIPNASVIHTLGLRDTIYFCWTPSDSDTISNPRCFDVIVTDDNCPYFATRFETFCLTVIPSAICDPLSVNDNLNELYSFHVFPQPATEQMKIVFDKFIPEKNYSLAIYSIVGKELFKTTVDERETNVNVSQLPAGLYIARVVDEKSNAVYSRKISVVR